MLSRQAPDGTVDRQQQATLICDTLAAGQGETATYLFAMADTDVLYNAGCPVCSREIDHYARLSAAQALPVRYDDLNDAKALEDWGVTADEAAQRLHVRKNGQLYIGVPAFIVLWQSLPRYRWLAQLVSLPGVYRLACWTYDGVLAPMLYRSHLKRQQKSA